MAKENMMSQPVGVYENCVGALVVNDCPEGEHSHFLLEGNFDNFQPNENGDGGTYECNGETIEVVVTG
jgi:hypothetical protein